MGALIGSLDGGSTWFRIGTGPTRVTGPGELLLSANDCPGPGGGNYSDNSGSLSVAITPATLVVRRLTTSPAAPVAGRLFTMRLVAARSDTGAVLQSGRVTCVGRAGNARLRARTARVAGGEAVCTWLIPKGAKGKTFRGSVTVVSDGLRATRSISRRIA